MARYDGVADWYDETFLGELHRKTLPEAVGMHPCFVGPHSRRFPNRDEVPELHEGYLVEGRYGADAPGVGPIGVRSKIGALGLRWRK